MERWERSQLLVTDSEDKTEEDTHGEEALWACGYPSWSLSKVRSQIDSSGKKKQKNHRKIQSKGRCLSSHM